MEQLRSCTRHVLSLWAQGCEVRPRSGLQVWGRGMMGAQHDGYRGPRGGLQEMRQHPRT